MRRGHDGFALVFVVGMLAVLAVLGTTFMSLTTMDRHLGRNFRHEVEARLVAESGVDYAIARLNALSGGSPTPEELREFHFNESSRAAFARPANALTNAAADAAVEISGAVENAAANVAGLSDYTLWLADESGKLNLNDSNTPPAYSRLKQGDAAVRAGRLYLTVQTLGDILYGRGTALAEALFLDRITMAPADDTPLEILENLEEARVEAGDALQDMPATTARRFASMNDVDAALRRPEVGLTEAEIQAFHDFVTLESWQDPNVIRAGLPVLRGEVSELLNQPIDRWSEFQTREYALDPRSPVHVNTARVELLQALIQPVSGVYLEEGPADTTSSEHYGFWATTLGTDPNAGKFGTIQQTPPFTEEQALLLAQAMHYRVHHGLLPGFDPSWAFAADRLPQDSDPFETWEEFRYFLQRELSAEARKFIFDADFGAASTMPDPMTSASAWQPYVDPQDAITGGFPAVEGAYRPSSYDLTVRQQMPVLGGLAIHDQTFRLPSQFSTWQPAEGMEHDAWWSRYRVQRRLDALYANFNPNTLSNDYNPNRNVYLTIDKGQLLRNTAELSLQPTGMFQIRCQSRVRAPGGDALATCTLRARVEIYTLLRITSQAQFMAGLDDDPEANLGDYFSEMPASHRLETQYSNTGVNRVGGLWPALQSYPEAIVAGQGTERIRRSIYDGCLMLNTLRTYPKETEDLSTEDINFPLTLLSSFNGYDATGSAEVPDPFQAWGPLGVGPAFQAEGVNELSAAPLTVHETDRYQEPGNLHPDGVYCERGRAWNFPMGGLVTGPELSRGLRGMVGFWFKPNFHPGISTRVRKLVCGPSQAGNKAVRQMAPALFYFPNGMNHDGKGWGSLPIVGDTYYTRWAAMQQLYGFGDYSGQYAQRYRNFWMPARGLAGGWAWQSPEAPGQIPPRTGAYSFHRAHALRGGLTGDYPGSLQTSRQNELQVLDHAWNYAALAWDMYAAGATAQKFFAICINGRSQDWKECGSEYTRYNHGTLSLREKMQYERFQSGSWQGPFATVTHVFSSQVDFTNEYLRFGEFLGDDTAAPYAADCTIDDVQGRDLPNGQTAARLRHPWPQGRYMAVSVGGMFFDELGRYSQSIAVYTTPALDLQALLRAGQVPLSLRSVAWTYYRSMHNRESGTSATAPARHQDRARCSYWAYSEFDRPDPMMSRWGQEGEFVDANAAPWHIPAGGTIAGVRPVQMDLRGSDGAWYYTLAQVQLHAPGVSSGALATSAFPLLGYPGGNRFRDHHDVITIQDAAADAELPSVTAIARYLPGQPAFLRVALDLARIGENGIFSASYFQESPVLDDITLAVSRDWPVIREWAMEN